MTTNNERITVAIIGTAGRQEDAYKLSKERYDFMVEETTKVITEKWGLTWDRVHMISGGAAYADAVAVELFRKHQEEGAELTLELPCPWDEKKTQFKDTFVRGNTGGVANYYHRKFSEKCGLQSLYDLQDAMERGAHVRVGKGFHDRNNQVSKAERMIAMTFGTTQPSSSGTSHTWNLHKGEKVHISLLKK